jgi:glutamate-1-semialdehyde aminotransferase
MPSSSAAACRPEFIISVRSSSSNSRPSIIFASLFYYLIREQGIHILEGFPGFLTTAHDDADLAKVVEAFDAASAQMMAAGLFGRTPESAGARQGQLTESQMEI